MTVPGSAMMIICWLLMFSYGFSHPLGILHESSLQELSNTFTSLRKSYPGKRPQTVCVRSVSSKPRDLDALGSREAMVVMKVGIVVTCESECE